MATMNKVLSLLQNNRLREARQACEEVCAAQPGSAQAQFMMSAICGQLGDYENSELYCKRAISIDPSVPEAHFNLGVIRMRMDKNKLAIESMRSALRLRPVFPEANTELGNALQRIGRSAEAVRYYKRAIEQRPDYASAYYNLGMAQLAAGENGAAIGNLRASIERNPALVEAYLKLSEIYSEQGDRDEALNCLYRIRSVQPDNPHVNLQLAELTINTDKEEGLQYCQRAMKSGAADAGFFSRLGILFKALDKHEASIECYRRALSMKPDDARLLTSLGVGLTATGKLDEAIEKHRQAIELEPQLAGVHFNLGCSLAKAMRFREAEQAYKKAVSLSRELPDAWNNLGTLQMLQGRIEESIGNFDAVLGLENLHELAASNRLFAMNYTSDRTQQEVYAAHKQWGELVAEKTGRQAEKREAGENGGTIRIGFVSPDFRTQSVAYYFKSLLGHGEQDIELHCYSNTRLPDATTEEIKGLVDVWHDITYLTDIQVAELLRRNRVDVLVDLAGHTSDNRLGIFELRPCGVQITYIGYPNTTGLSAMDYRITDLLSDPVENNAYYVEKLLRMKQCFLCYTPPDDAPEAVHGTHVTDSAIRFGSFNNLAKVSDEIIRDWSAILQQVPDSVLVLKNQPLCDREVADMFKARLLSFGIHEDRVELLPWDSKVGNHLEKYNNIDIALDTYPYNGTTTTCEALWMDCPVVTRSGKPHASRVGMSLMHVTGLEELVATGSEEYVEIAAGLAGRLGEFRGRHGNLREKMRKSPLCDRKLYQADFYSLIRGVMQGVGGNDAH